MPFSDHDLRHIEEYADAFTFEKNRTSGKTRRNRGMKVGNKSRKQARQWSSSQPERSVLRYSTGGWYR